MRSFKALLSGSQPLSKALGRYLILGGFLVLTASSVIGVIVITVFPGARIGVYVAQFAVFWAYVLLAAIGTWRSANQTNGRLTIVAKAVVVLLATLFLASFFRPNGVIAMVTGTWQPGSYLQDIMKQQ
jgi:hypothetical protein